jgi:hypothetical protein
MVELKRAIPDLKRVGGAPNETVYVNNAPYSDWLTLDARYIGANVFRSIATPDAIHLRVYEVH